MSTPPGPHPLFRLALALAGCAPLVGPARGGEAPSRPAHVAEYAESIRPLIVSRCVECHGRDGSEGGVNLARVTKDDDVLRSRKLWRRAAARVASGEMPPPDDPGPFPDAEKQRLVRWLRAAADYSDCDDPDRRDPGPAPFRRLTRHEYENTVRDLLGFGFDAGGEAGMPEDDGGEGFDNLSAGLGVSAPLMEAYFTAADRLVDAVFAADGRGENARKRLFVARPGPELTDREAARAVLTRLARRAFRRPPGAEDVDRLLGFYDRAAAKGEPFEGAVKAALKPVLVSPRFLFRVEADRPPTAPDRPGVPVDGHELAVRLSYFLWSTMPDEALDRVADAGGLSDPAVFDAQVTRMLADGKARSLTDRFAAQWLQLKKLDRARPTTEFFPSFNGTLKNAMCDEILTFIDRLRRDDRSLLDLLDADYTYANETLAAHYGLSGVKGPEFRRVTLGPGDHRGGLLGMAGVLTMTSHTFRTSPTQRGKYVLEVVYGTPPPPPPPDAGQLKDDKPAAGGKAPQTFRDQLARHASQASCAGCHRKVDPLGFALENFNAIGAWRESTPEAPLDVRGALPGGESIEGAAGLKRVLLRGKDDFARNVVQTMLVYALGRQLDDIDECSVADALSALKRDDYRVSTLIRGVVRSAPFRLRRAATAP